MAGINIKKGKMRRKIQWSACLAAGVTLFTAEFGLAQSKPKVAFVPQIVGIPYFNAMDEGGKDAAQKFDVEFVYTGPTDTNPAEQLRIVNGLIDQGTSAIALSVLDASSIDPIIKKAKEKGIKIFTSDSDAPKSEREVYVAQALDQGLGFTIIDELAKLIGEQGTVGIVSGEATATNLNTWIGFMQQRVKDKYPRITLLPPQFAGGTAQRAFQLATDLMTAHPDLKGLIAVASTTCPGVAQAIESAGKIGQVIGTGYGSPNTVRSYLKSGAFGFSVLWNPRDLGYLTVWAGKQLIDEKPFTESNDVPGLSQPVKYNSATKVLLLGPPTVFTKDNVDQFNF
ncbi:MAG TPA: autoinducer 2 ABC transporter substrate-binding protein [Chthoniobacterales bacterium]|jgi:rhamnose transport system substrate-binding protein|nr:autoinducer 2 ABC transporter substrate-binding protein [Chthoniobacterales bacterium]